MNALNPTKPSKWMEWKPKSILANSAGTTPTKPTEPGFVGFVGATVGESAEIESEPNPVELSRASTVLGLTGVRIMVLEGGATIGVWSDKDGPEVRAALRTLGVGHLPVRYLGGAGIPIRYKSRTVEGEPVPSRILAEMERNPTEPWRVRDRLLNEIGVVHRSQTITGDPR